MNLAWTSGLEREVGKEGAGGGRALGSESPSQERKASQRKVGNFKTREGSKDGTLVFI